MCLGRLGIEHFHTIYYKVVAVGSKGVLDVALEEDVAALDEVVVVGFGTQKKASVVGSITNINCVIFSLPIRFTPNLQKSI